MFFKTKLYLNWARRVTAAGTTIVSAKLLGISKANNPARIFCALVQVRLKAKDGIEYERTLTLRGDSVVIIPICSVKPFEFVLVEQFRPGSGEFSCEFPAGARHDSELPLSAAVRELYEETGLKVNPDSVEKLSALPLVVCESAFDETAHWYYVQVDREAVETNLKVMHGDYNDGERITITIKSLSELKLINSFHIKTALQLMQTKGLFSQEDS